MKRISFSEAKAGMVLLQPITDQQGRVIVNAGARLNQLYISRLEKWGVKEICVAEEEDGASATQVMAEMPAAAQPAESQPSRSLPPGVYRGPGLMARVRRTFARVMDDPLMAALHASVSRRLGEFKTGKKP
jgi:hypothetical protein